MARTIRGFSALPAIARFRSRHQRLLDPQLRQILHRPGQHRFAVANHDGALNEFGMGDHYSQQFFATQAFVRDVLLVGRFLRADDTLGPQPCLAQQSLQLGSSKRLLEVVDCFKLDAMLSQDTPDLPASASGRLLVNGNSVLLHVFTPIKMAIKATQNRISQIPLSCWLESDPWFYGSPESAGRFLRS